jgi:hypothetical protein
MNNLKNKFIPHIVAITLFFIISLIFFYPVMQGKKLAPHDIMTYKGMSKEITDFTKKTGEHSLWTNSMFGGMPTYLIKNYAPNNLIKYFDQIFKLKYKVSPVNYLFMYFLGFYIMLLLFGLNSWQSFLGAIAFGLSSYFLIIIEAGHITKVIALGYMPPIVGGVYAAYKGKRLIGAVIMSLFLSMQLMNNHLQITFYTILLLIPLIIIFFIDAFKTKKLNEFIKSSAVLLIGLILVVGTNFQSLITTYEYGKESLRGESELHINKENQTSGLDKDYATAWSYGKLETFNMFIPNLTGGASGSELSEKSATYNNLIKLGAPKKQAKQIIKQMPTYWGPQPFTSGPVYVGALILFLFVMGIFLVKGSVKTWLITATILSILLAWGKNFMFFSDLFFDYFPGYNKFRTVSMTLVIAQLTIPLLGLLALKNIIDNKVSKQEILKALKYSTAILGGLALLFIINPGLLSFSSPADSRLPEYLQSTIVQDRASMMRSDAFRSIFFVLIGAVSIWMFIKTKISKTTLYIILGIAILIDLWGVDRRYLNSDDFVSKQKIKKPYTASTADKFILQDKSLDYRVLNLAVSTFNDASTSYFHKSIGGYHGAKMRRYQELIDFEISKEIQSLISVLQAGATQNTINAALMKLQALNMLNAKYIIYNPNAQPLINPFVLGNAWFVENIKMVEDANQEIKEVQNFNPAQTAIVDKRFKDLLFDFKKDSAALIKLITYKPNYLKYETKTQSNQFAVFSEIYYDKGWNAYVDGKKAPHFRVNYVLRAMEIPAGNHTVEFKFEPVSWKTGGMISLISSILLIIVMGFVVYIEYKASKKEELPEQ